MSGAKISSIGDGTPAHNAGLRVGDEILFVNGVPPTDVIEYQSLVDGAEVSIDLSPIVDRITARTFCPEPFRNSALGRSLGTDFGRDQFVEPAHVRPLEFRRMGY